MKTDNTAVSHFLTQPKLSSKQARLQELLAEFNFWLEYKAGSTNKVADALSRRVEFNQQANAFSMSFFELIVKYPPKSEAKSKMYYRKILFPLSY